ncbi:hypothetical protein D3C72_1790280 [compost metagenome]
MIFSMLRTSCAMGVPCAHTTTVSTLAAFILDSCEVMSVSPTPKRSVAAILMSCSLAISSMSFRPPWP